MTVMTRRLAALTLSLGLAARCGAAAAGRAAEGQVRHDSGRLRGRGLSRQGAQDGGELPAVREGQALRRHDLPPRDRQLHGAGRRLRHQLRRKSRRARRCRTKAGGAGQGRAEERGRHPRDGPHQRPEFGHCPVLHQRQGQRLPRSRRDSAGRSGAALRIPGPRLRERAARHLDAPQLSATPCSARSSAAWTCQQDQGHAHRRRRPVPQRRARRRRSSSLRRHWSNKAEPGGSIAAPSQPIKDFP